MQIRIHNLNTIDKFVYYINYKQMFPTYLFVVWVIAAILGLIGGIWLDEVIRNKNSLKNRFIPAALIAISTGIMLFQLGFILPSLMKLPNSDLVKQNMPLTKYTEGIEFHDLNLKPGKISQIKLKNSNVVIANVYWNSLYKITIKPTNKTCQAWLNNYKYLKAKKINTQATNIKIKTDNIKTQARYTLPDGKCKTVSYALQPNIVYNKKVK